MGRFLDFSFTVYNLHRAGQDDLDSHAKRMENRIIRSSTRLADFAAGEMSDYYKGQDHPPGYRTGRYGNHDAGRDRG